MVFQNIVFFPNSLDPIFRLYIAAIDLPSCERITSVQSPLLTKSRPWLTKERDGKIQKKVKLFVERPVHKFSHLDFFVVMKAHNSLSIIPSSINKYCLTEREMVVYVCFCLWEGYFRYRV